LKEEAWKKFINTNREEDRLQYNLKKHVGKRKVEQIKTDE